jgi:hypothetical protein
MMKKLAVAVFALSLTALGCGSDDGGGKTDAAPKLDTVGAEVVTQPDVPVGPEAGPETQKPDVPALDQAVDKVTPIDQTVDQSTIDVPTPLDVPTIDGPAPKLDGGVLDTQAGEAAAPIDGGVDTGRVG